MRNAVALSKVKKFVAVVLMFLTLAFCIEPVAYAHKTRYRHRHRTFWQKHRDKLTVAGTTLGGAGIGGLAGGKKGAVIGALVGGEVERCILTRFGNGIGIADTNRRKHVTSSL